MSILQKSLKPDAREKRIFTKLGQLERENAKLKLSLRLFLGAAYPVSTEIDTRGYRWSEAYLDQARSTALATPAAQTPAPTAEPLTRAAADVLAERFRQMHKEGWMPDHDDEHDTGELASAAAAYAEASPMAGQEGAQYGPGDPPESWPWDVEYWKPCDQRRMLVKAGALILAEIERLDRAASTKDQA